MAVDDGWRRDVVTKGLFVVVGVAYMLAGPPVFGLDPQLVGSALVAYGVVSFVGKRAIARWGVLDRE